MIVAAKKNVDLLRLLGHGFLLCLALLLFSSCGSTKTIVNGLDEKEANEIIVYLSSKNIDAAKVPSTEGGGGAGSKVFLWDITVNEEQATEAMSLLNQVGLPRRRGQNLLNIFSAGGLVPSELQEKIRYQAGLAEQIASTIRKIDGVLDAEVQISFPEEDPLNPNANKGKITSSVYVKHSGVLDDPNSHLITKIKRLVAASITGLDYDNVTVIADRARYSGMPTPGEIQSAHNNEDKPLINVWTVVLAKESLLRFRLIFFSFLIVILLLVLSLIWLGWKTYPLLKEHGGIKELLHIHPIGEKKEHEAETKEKEESAKKDQEAKKEDEGKIDQDIEET